MDLSVASFYLGSVSVSAEGILNATGIYRHRNHQAENSMRRDDIFGEFRLLAFCSEIKDVPYKVMVRAAELQMIATDALWQ